MYCKYVRDVHNSYLDYYVYKTCKTLSQKYNCIVKRLHHEIYIPSIQTGKIKKIKCTVVRDFINELIPEELFAILYM